MISFRPLILLSAAFAIAILSAGPPALASDNDGGNETGGYVLPGSLAGVNPVYHPGIFRNSNAAKAYGFAPLPHRSHRQGR